MKRLSIILTVLLLLVVSKKTSAQTTVTIVGTVHNATPAFSKLDLYQILEKCNPDLILFELDSALMGAEMRFKKQFLNIFEVSVIDSFLMVHPTVLLRPFDIEGRNNFFVKTDYFSQEGRMFTEIGRLYNSNSLSPEYMRINQKALALSSAADKYASQSAIVVNSKEVDDAVEEKMTWYHQNFPQVIRNTPSLRQYEHHMSDDSTFWQRRNKAMANHIKQFAQLFAGKRIVVVTGHYHRYLLRKLLSPMGEIRLKEYFEL